MKITFAGGADSIGASCALLECGGKSLLIDCGTRPGDSTSPLPDLSILDTAPRPEAAIITHAHTDHSGALPVLAASFPGLPLLATPPTIDLVTILLQDSLKIMNSSDREGDIPLFSKEQVETVCRQLTPLRHGEPRTIGPFTCTLYPAGHILGASMLHITTSEGYVLFTGDYSSGAQRTVGALLKPALPVDLLITEATYGNRLHEERKAAETRIVGQVREITEQGGRVLIPCFAVGRAQEILLLLRTAMRNGQLPAIPVFVDGMVRAVCNVYSGHEQYVTDHLARDIRNSRHPFFSDTIVPVQSSQQREEALTTRPAVFVASSGMLNGGASVFYARELLRNRNDAILLTGYQDEESPGRKLLALAEPSDAPRSIILQGETIEIQAKVALFGLSAHADRLQMAAFIDSCKPRSIVLVHGDRQAREALKSSLSCSDSVCIHDGESVERTYPVRRPSHHTSATDTAPFPDTGDIPRVRALLGPPSDIPVRASAVAQAWFGLKTGSECIERFAQRLIDLGLVRRHDERRTLLQVLHPSRTDILHDEAVLIERLKKENPKGKLLEHCMRVKIPFPTTEFGSEGAFRTARMIMTYNGRTFNSGVQQAGDKTAAEQLAAKRLLDLCETAAAGQLNGTTVDVEETDIERLKGENPKGRLIEWCVKTGCAAPEFHSVVVAGSWCTRVTVTQGDESFHSLRYRHHQRKVSEHAAAAEALAKVKKTGVRSGRQPDVPASRASPPGTATTPSAENNASDPLTSLNILRQRGYITDFGFTEPVASGPPHAPVFECKAWAQFNSEERIESPPCTGGSKKSVCRSAARALLVSIGAML